LGADNTRDHSYSDRVEYRVEEIARAAGVRVDTVRFYQSRGLLDAPERRGRRAIYSEAHLEQLQRIRALNRQGLTLEAVGRLLQEERQGPKIKASLLRALDEMEAGRTFSREELAQRADVPEFLIESAEQAGLLQPLGSAGEPRYTETDLAAVRAATTLLRAGVPLQELLPIAQDHSAHIEAISERAIDLFDRYVRHAQSPGAHPSSEEVKQAFRELLPAATTLVAMHFQRTLVQRARARLAHADDPDALEATIEATGEPRLKLSWS